MIFNFNTAIAVGFGGFIGAISRFYITTQIIEYFPSQIPLATLFVNIIGSFMIGLLIGLFLQYA